VVVTYGTPPAKSSGDLGNPDAKRPPPEERPLVVRITGLSRRRPTG
jgi:hypothetical protein